MSDEPRVSIREVMIAWTGTSELDRETYPTTFGQVALFQWPDTHRRSRDFACTAGACNAETHKLKKLQRQHIVLSTALGLIVNYGIDPATVHRALWPLKEYRDGMPLDTTPPKNE